MESAETASEVIVSVDVGMVGCEVAFLENPMQNGVDGIKAIENWPGLDDVKVPSRVCTANPTRWGFLLRNEIEGVAQFFKKDLDPDENAKAPALNDAKECTEILVTRILEIILRKWPTSSLKILFSYPTEWSKDSFKVLQIYGRVVNRAFETCYRNGLGSPQRVDVQQGINEAQAAATYFIHQVRPLVPGYSVVVDLGGATLDIAIIRSDGQEPKACAFDGAYVGCSTIDSSFIDYFEERLSEAGVGNDSRVLARKSLNLIQQRLRKYQYESWPKVFSIPLANGSHISLDVPDLADIILLPYLKNLTTVLDKCLKSRDEDSQPINHIFLTGGGALNKSVRHHIEENYGRNKFGRTNAPVIEIASEPLLAVAKGQLLHAHKLMSRSSVPDSNRIEVWRIKGFLGNRERVGEFVLSTDTQIGFATFEIKSNELKELNFKLKSADMISKDKFSLVFDPRRVLVPVSAPKIQRYTVKLNFQNFELCASVTVDGREYQCNEGYDMRSWPKRSA